MGLNIDKQRLNFGREYSQTNNQLRYKSLQGTWTSTSSLWSWSDSSSTLIFHTISMCPRPASQGDVSPPTLIGPSNATSSTSSGTARMCRLSAYLSTTGSIQTNTNGACVVRQAGTYYQHCVLLDKKTPLIVPSGTRLLLEAVGGSTLTTDLNFDYYVTFLEVKGG